MVEMGVENDEVGDGFRGDIELVQLVQKRPRDRADPALDNSIGLPPDQVEVKELTSQESDMVGYLKRQLHKIPLTHPYV